MIKEYLVYDLSFICNNPIYRTRFLEDAKEFCKKNLYKYLIKDNITDETYDIKF